MPEVTTPPVGVSLRPQVRIAGDVDVTIGERVTGLSVRHCLGAPSRLTFEVSARGSTEDDGAEAIDFADRFPLGTPVAIEAGDPAVTIFGGRVTARGHAWSARGPRVSITAHDGLESWTYDQRTRRFVDAAMADVAALVADSYSVSVQVAAAASGLTRSWVQFNQTDLEFFAGVCATVGADFFMEGDELFVQTAARAADSAVSLQYGQSLISFSAETNLSEQRTSIAVHGWDPGTKQAIGRRADFPDAELRECESGPRTLHDDIGRPAGVHLRPAADSLVHADTLARAVYEDRAHRFVIAHGVTDGEPALLVGEWVALSGLDERHDRRYYVREVRHRYNAQDGFTTAFVAQSPCAGQAKAQPSDDDDRGEKCGKDGDGKPGRGRRFDPFARAGRIARGRRRD